MSGAVNPQLLMPGSIPSDFAAQFAGLATGLGALPIRLPGITNIGADEPHVPHLSPLIAIDGTKRPDSEHKPAERRARGFESDAGLMHDLLDMHPTTFLREFNLSTRDLDWAHQDAPLSECPSMRDIIASSEASAKALIFFAPAFTQILNRFATARARYATALSRSKSGGTRPSRVPPPPERPSVEKPNELEFAMQYFLHGALLARAGQDVLIMKAEKLFIESAKLFKKVERFAAAAMMQELAEEIQIRQVRRSAETTHKKAEMWLDALRTGNDAGFEDMYYRALNAVQFEAAGSGTLRGIIRSSMAYYRDFKDKEELTRTLIRHVWTKLMQAENPATLLSGMDWLDIHSDLIVVEDRLKSDGNSTHARIAEGLAQMALGFADEITVAEKRRKSDAP